MPEGIVKLADQSLARLFTITPIGLIVSGKPTLDEYGIAIDCFVRCGEVSKLCIGDAMLVGEHQIGEEFFQLFDEKSIRTKNRYMQVCREIPMSQRRPELTYSHYVEVVRIKDKARQAKLMDEAVKYKLSSRDLKKTVDDALGKTSNYTLDKFVDSGNKFLDDWEERLNGEDYYKGISKLFSRLSLEIEKRRDDFEKPQAPIIQPVKEPAKPSKEAKEWQKTHGNKQSIMGRV